MSRVDRRYFLIIDKVTKRVEDNCPVCAVVSQSGAQPLPFVDGNHLRIENTRAEHSAMLELEEIVDLQTGKPEYKFKYKWDTDKKKPELKK